jgi:hypothetical protein
MTMNAVIEDFEQRARDIRSYLRMLERMEVPGSVLRRPSGSRTHSVAVEENWRVIGKATAYLLLYNLVESAVRSGLDRLYLAVEADQCTCQTLSRSIRSVWIDQKHRAVRHENASPVNYRQAASELVEEIVQKRIVQLSAEELPGAGSLDAARIRDVCRRHDLELKVHKNAKGGSSLVTVKSQRNALAHGDKSFAECGRDVTLKDLQQTAKETEIYVRGFLRSLERFIAKKRYMAPASTP